MQISKDPMAPLRTWKELFLGERALKSKRSLRPRSGVSRGTPFTMNSARVAVGH